jgi:SAM-dependent methyltransferase
MELTSIPQSDVTETPCPVCGSFQRRPLFEEHGFPLWRCRRCTHAYVSPRPSERWLARYYETCYLPQAEDEKQWEGPLDEIYEVTCRAVAAAVPRRGSLLDVGSGYGGFLRRAAEDGWRIHGIEPSRAAGQVAHARLGESARLWHGTFDGTALEPASMDCIVMLNVIEHVREPLEVCRRALEVLRPGGCLALRWPQMVFMHEWMRRLHLTPIALGVPSHLHDFTSRGMETLLQRAGFTSVHHAWAGMQTYRDRSVKSRLAIQALRMTLRSVDRLTRGRGHLPIGSRLSLGLKPNPAQPEPNRTEWIIPGAGAEARD